MVMAAICVRVSCHAGFIFFFFLLATGEKGCSVLKRRRRRVGGVAALAGVWTQRKRSRKPLQRSRSHLTSNKGVAAYRVFVAEPVPYL